MLRFTLALLLCTSVVVSNDTDLRPILAPNSRLNVAVSGTPSPGYFLIGSVDSDSIGLIDNAGVLLYPHQTGPSANISPSPYGGLTFFHGRLGRYVLLSNNLEPIDTFGVEAPYTTDFHEGYQTRGRRYIVLGVEERTIDMSTLVPNGKYDAIVLGAVIQEFDRYGRKTFEWKSLDHISPLHATPDVDLTNKRIDYIHVNSIVEDTDRNFIVSCRNLDQVIKIDRTTGAVIWRFGGTSAAHSDFAIVNDNNSGFHGFSHQHTAVRARNGEIILFDNGNLRPIPFSRAVAYRLDEVSKTATKTWEYVSREMQISSTMGSVQELPNGNILIGWGSTPTGLVASEVDRTGTLHAEVTTFVPITIPYRVRKSPIAMTASTRTLDTLRRFNFEQGDSTTRISVDVSSFVSPTLLSVEKHSYAPHNLAFGEEYPCNILPIRWVVRRSDTGHVEASVSFNLYRLLGDLDVEDIDIYHRPEENTGTFAVVPSDVLTSPPTRRIPQLLTGEYIVAAKHCSEPALRVPNNNSVVGSSVTMEWTEALGADGYEIEVSEDPSFLNESSLYRTLYNDTTLTGFLPGTTYYWRVRVIRQPEVGPWTTPWSFTIPVPSTVSDDTQPLAITYQGSHLHIDPSLQPQHIDVYDITGRRILRAPGVSTFDVSFLSSGTYLVAVTTISGTYQTAIIAR